MGRDHGAIRRGKNPRPPTPKGLLRPSPPPNPPTPPRREDRHRPHPPPPDQHRHPHDGRPSRRSDVRKVAHVPYPTGVEKGTVRGIHGRKYGAVWVEYPGGTTLYEVSRSLLFPSLQEAKRYREEAGASKKKPKPPAPKNEESNPPNAKPTTEPTNPTNPTNPPSGPAKMWDPTTGSHAV